MPFEAMYNAGQCTECDGYIKAGQMLEVSSTGYQHVTCPTEDKDLHPVCTTCFLVHPPGTCDRV